MCHVLGSFQRQVLSGCRCGVPGPWVCFSVSLSTRPSLVIFILWLVARWLPQLQVPYPHFLLEEGKGCCFLGSLKGEVIFLQQPSSRLLSYLIGQNWVTRPP